MIRQPTT